MNASGYLARLLALGLILGTAGCGPRESAEAKSGKGHHHDHDEDTSGHAKPAPEKSVTAGGHDEHGHATNDHAHDKDEHDHGHEEQEETGVRYKEGVGLTLVPEVIQALNLRTAVVAEQTLTEEWTVTAHVFAEHPRRLATARMPNAQAGRLPGATVAGATLVRVDPLPEAATRLVDAVFALEPGRIARVGDFVSLQLKVEPRPALCVPRSAVLDAATGTAVYRVRGDAYLRVPVKLGAESAGFVEITEGVRAGDVVVTSPVEQLWLAELRLTKGGGHSH